MDREMMALSGRMSLGNGLVLRLLSGMELLEARRDGGAGLTVEPPLILEDAQGNKTAAWHAAYDRI